jgi:hypothetical protein
MRWRCPPEARWRAVDGIGGQADEAEQIDYAFTRLGAAAGNPMDFKRPSDEFADTQTWVQRGARVLKHWLHMPPHVPQAASRKHGNVLDPETFENRTSRLGWHAR